MDDVRFLGGHGTYVAGSIVQHDLQQHTYGRHRHQSSRWDSSVPESMGDKMVVGALFANIWTPSYLLRRLA